MAVYLLDTSALIDDPDILYQFDGENTLVISTTTTMELDDLKESKNRYKSGQARKVINILNKERLKGRLYDGVELDNGSTLRVLPPNNESDIFSKLGRKPDVEIISTVLRPEFTGVYAVSVDNNFKVQSNIAGLEVFEYESKEQIERSKGYLGYIRIDDNVLANSLVANHVLHIARIPEEYELYENTYIVFGNEKLPPEKSTVGVVKGEYVELVRGNHMNSAGKFRVKNIGQKLLATAIMDKQITVVTCEGVAGTGKTLEALAFSLKQVDDRERKRVICYRAIAPLDDGLGALPGTKEEKLAPWAQPILDNLEVLGREDLFLDNEELDPVLEIDALTYARGRSLPNVIIIVDEAQNLTRLQAKTMATRLGEGSMIIFLYDPEQIDHKYLDRWSNGGTHVATRLRGQKIHAHITLTETVRSETASICAKLL